MRIFNTILLSVFCLALNAQISVYGGFMDSNLEQSIIAYNVGTEVAFNYDKGFDFALRLAFSERGGKMEGKTIKTKSIQFAYIARQNFNMNEENRLFIFGGIGMDGNKDQGEIRNSYVIPFGVGIDFNRFRTWFEWQANLTDDYTAGGINVAVKLF